MSHHYATDWRQCWRCGCTLHQSTLRALSLVDHVLNLTSDVYECRDIPQCDRFRAERNEMLAREQGLSLEPAGIRRNR